MGENIRGDDFRSLQGVASPLSTCSGEAGEFFSVQQDQPSDFRTRLDSSNQYNTLFVDRNCASCMTGMAPQILTQIKLACLSYVNSPVKYSGLDISFADIVQVKEHLLR